MAQWTSVQAVREAKVRGKSIVFPPAMVWAASYVARTPYPRKFTYLECPHVEDQIVCGKTSENGPHCGHNLTPVIQFRFQLFLYDAYHASCTPVRAHIWDAAGVLLGCSALDFSHMSEQNQIRAIDTVLHKCPRLQVIFLVKDLKLHIQSISEFNDSCLFPLGTPSPSTSRNYQQHGRARSPGQDEARVSAKKPRSARKILVDGLGDIILALESVDSDNALFNGED